MVNGFLAGTEYSSLLRELRYISMYVISDIIRVWTEGERLPRGSLITVNINSVFLDTFASGKAIALFSCCERVCDLEMFLKPQTVFPFPPDIVLVNESEGFTGRGRTCGCRATIVLDRVDAETITVAVA